MSLLLLFGGAPADLVGSASPLQAENRADASGSPGVTGSASQLQAGGIASASGSPTSSGPLSAVQAQQQQIASGTISVSGSAALLQSNQAQLIGAVSDSVLLYGTRILAGLSGSVDASQPGDLQSALGSVSVSGSASPISAQDSAAAVGAAELDSVRLYGVHIQPPAVAGSVDLQQAGDLLAAQGATQDIVRLYGAQIVLGIGGSLSLIQLDDVMAAAGSALVLGASQTQQAVNFAEAAGSLGSVGVSGEASLLQAASFSAASGSPTASGQSALLQAIGGSSAAGSPLVSGPVVPQQANDLASASGSPLTIGSAAATGETDTAAILAVTFANANLILAPELTLAHVPATGHTMFVDAVLGVYVAPEAVAQSEPGNTAAV